VAVPAVALAARVQLAAGVNVPVEFDAKLTEPVGVMTVPAVEVSLTVAVQFVPWFTTTDAGVHETLVEVVRGLTVKVNAVAVALPEWVESPA
jgi:Na+/H+ antiporter NhaA